MTDWKKFVEATKDRKPNGYILDALRIFKLKKGDVLDIGCGPGVDARYLGQLGFHVTAFDSDPNSVKAAQEITAGLPVTILEQKIEDFVFDEAGYDLIIAWRSIPFLQKPQATDALLKIQKHLRPGGVGVIAIFGPDDGWAHDRKGMSFFTVDELKNLWPSMKFVRTFEERAEASLAAGGSKFFHMINCIVQKTS